MVSSRRVAGLTAILALVLAGCADSEEQAVPFTPETEHLFVVPVDLPEGYRPPAHGDQQTAGNRVEAAAWHYFPAEGVRDGWRVVRLCVSPDPDYGNCAVPGGAVLIRQEEVHGRSVRVIALDVRDDEGPHAPGWLDVELTAGWPEVDWLDV